jgi:hypothetical protein
VKKTFAQFDAEIAQALTAPRLPKTKAVRFTCRW